MDALAWLSILSTLISLACCAVALATLRSVRAFVSSRPQKRLSDLEVSQAELASTLESATSALKRLSSKHTMRERRAAARDDAPPATKEDAKRRYLAGRTHQQIALMAMNGADTRGED